MKIGEALGAKFIVVGSISKIGNLFSVNAKLINVESSELIKSISDQMGDLVFNDKRNERVCPKTLSRNIRSENSK